MPSLPRLPGLIGRVGGALLAPLSGLIASVRHSRVLHPAGVVYRAVIRPVPNADARVVARVSGPALVRLSSAWWKTREWPDVLGVAVRLRTTTVASTAADAGDQDLLFATVRRPWLLPVAALTTHHHDFMSNDYYAVSPFLDDDLGRVRWRRRSAGDAADFGDATRAERLARAVRNERAIFHLEVSSAATPAEALYEPVADLVLLDELDIDQAALRFSPFRDGHGIHPTGFIQNLRPAIYRESQEESAAAKAADA